MADESEVDDLPGLAPLLDSASPRDLPLSPEIVDQAQIASDPERGLDERLEAY